MKTLTRFTATLFLSIILISCEDEKPLITIENSGVPTFQEIDGIVHKFSQGFTRALNIPAVRSFIKQECTKQFDGDYNMLFAIAKSKKIYTSNTDSNLTFEELLINNGFISEELLIKISVQIPLLQISVPELEIGNVETWNTEGFVPKVAVLDLNYYKKLSNDVKTYDTNGSVSTIDRNHQPKELIIVIGHSERVRAYKKNKKQSENLKIESCLIDSDDLYEYYLTDCEPTYIDPGDSGPTTPNCYESCSRDCDLPSNYDIIKKIKFARMSSLNEAEDFLSGKVELRIWFLKGAPEMDQFSSSNKTYTRQKSDYRTCSGFLGLGGCETHWVTTDINTQVEWDFDFHGDRMLYVFIEEDSFISYTDETDKQNYAMETIVEGNRIVGEVGIYVPTLYDDMGSAWVFYCDNVNNTGSFYNTSDIEFNITR